MLKHSGNAPITMYYLFSLFLIVALSLQAGAGSASGEVAREGSAFYTFAHLTTADGLVGSSALAMVQDEQGFMWIGTQQGLNRYDGYQFKSYGAGPAPEGLSSANVHALLEDAEGTLWIGTWGGGLNRLDGETGQIAHYSAADEDGGAGEYDYIEAVVSDGAGGLWLGTRGGLSYFDPVREQFTAVTADAVSALAVAGGEVWLGTTTGLLAYEMAEGTVTGPGRRAEMGTTNALLFDSAGELWIGSEAGLWLLGEDGLSRSPLLPAETAVTALLEEGQGRLWAATRGSGLYLLDPAGGDAQQYRHDPDDAQSIGSDYVISLFKSRAGILWAGSWAEGLSLMRPRIFPPHQPLALPLGFAPAGQGDVWVGTFTEGLWRLGPDGERLANYRHDPAAPGSLSDDIVFTVLAAAEGGLWVGTLEGLDYLPPGEETFVHYRHRPGDPTSLSHERVRALYQDDEGQIWVGTSGGVNRFEQASGTFVPYPVAGEGAGQARLQSVLGLYGDEVGRLWVASEEGLGLLDPGTGAATVYNVNNSDLCHNFLTAIRPAGDGSLWLASWGGGLIHFDPETEQWRCYQREDGLVDNVVLAIAEDGGGHLWLSTPQGLSRFDPQTEQFHTYTTADGLPDNDFAQAAVMGTEGGELLFGNTYGVLRFRPEEIGANEYVPPVVLTQIYLADRPLAVAPEGPLTRPVPQSEEIRLAPGENAISFEFAALNYVNPEQNQYAYRLEGFDDWNDAGDRRFATYTNLNPGAYTFRVIASNDDGVWNEEGASIRVVIEAPWWQRWWAYLGYGALALLLLGAVVQVRTQVQGRALAHERRLRERMELIDGMKEAERERIARELHDGLAQTLAGLRFRARVWKTLLEQDPEQLEEELDELGAILEESIQDVRRSIFALRPASLEEMGLLPALEQLVQTVSQQYQLRVHVALPPALDAADPRLELAVFRIASELLSNAARHAGAGAIWLALKVDERQVRLEVRDNGQGFETAHLPAFAAEGHLGLRHLQERVSLLGGTLLVDSLPGEGTRVAVSLPIERSQGND